MHWCDNQQSECIWTLHNIALLEEYSLIPTKNMSDVLSYDIIIFINNSESHIKCVTLKRFFNICWWLEGKPEMGT